jgi:large subunit ribosomal protein L13
VDATGWAPGRLATYVSLLLQGKHKPHFDRRVDSGDYVVITNAAFVQLSGRTLTKKVYYSHSGWVGGLKETKLADVLDQNPAIVLRKAVSGMLPKDRCRQQRLSRLKVPCDF